MKNTRRRPIENGLHLRAHRDALGGVDVDVAAHGCAAIGVLAAIIAVIAVVIVIVVLTK